MLSGVRYGQRWRGILQIFDVGTACRVVPCLALAIRQGRLYGRHQVAAVGVGCSLCLYGIGLPGDLRGKTATYRWWVHPVDVCGLYDQGRCVVAEAKLSG